MITLGRLDRELLESFARVVGVDEVGRGSLAGPVVVGAAAFRFIPRRNDIRDSKQLTHRSRERAAAWVRSNADAWVVLEIGRESIDRFNILEATRRAMAAAVAVTARPGDLVVTDAMTLAESACDVLAPVRADARYFAVAAASIIAKVHRDRMMGELGLRHPQWGWERNYGYGTTEHRRELTRDGRSFLHRRSFAFRPCVTMSDDREGRASHGREPGQDSARGGEAGSKG